MPVGTVDNYTIFTYPDLSVFQTDIEKLYTLGWLLVSFAFDGTSIVAVYRRQQAVLV